MSKKLTFAYRLSTRYQANVQYVNLHGYALCHIFAFGNLIKKHQIMITKNCFRTAVFALLLFSVQTVSFAGTGGNTPPPPDKDLLKPIGPVKPYHKNRPKAPGIYDVYAWTEAGTLTVQFVRPAGTCEMTVTSDYDPIGQTYTFSSEMSFSTTVDTSGPELYIEIVTEVGTTYIGDIPVE